MPRRRRGASRRRRHRRAEARPGTRGERPTGDQAHLPAPACLLSLTVSHPGWHCAGPGANQPADNRRSPSLLHLHRPMSWRRHLRGIAVIAGTRRRAPVGEKNEHRRVKSKVALEPNGGDTNRPHITRSVMTRLFIMLLFSRVPICSRSPMELRAVDSDCSQAKPG